jgi:hypothetical protein
VFQAASDDAIPRELRTVGFVLILGIRADSKETLLDVLKTIDICHYRPEAFVLASGGLYCLEEDLLNPQPVETDVHIDLSLPMGLHTSWHNCLLDRPLLHKEAQTTLMHTRCLVGTLGVLLGDTPWFKLGDTPSEPILEKVPPLFRCIWEYAAQLQNMPPATERCLRRRLRNALMLAESPFDHTSIRHLGMEYNTTTTTQ